MSSDLEDWVGLFQPINSLCDELIRSFLLSPLFLSETEASITATERVDAMSRIEQERPMITSKEDLPPDDWPTSGNLVFDRVCLRYRESLPLALNDLTFSIPAGKKAGLVGRTGAGKSSITVAVRSS